MGCEDGKCDERLEDGEGFLLLEVDEGFPVCVEMDGVEGRRG